MELNLQGKLGENGVVNTAQFEPKIQGLRKEFSGGGTFCHIDEAGLCWLMQADISLTNRQLTGTKQEYDRPRQSAAKLTGQTNTLSVHYGKSIKYRDASGGRVST
ncbi:hypothetical protein GcC1_195033 [Golovinomyces cichoracearum]|uniref:Uncharacterized protein n=1 Tax=Golovinomyces cichoracearum TaxID=62708 RepID=A0A420HGW6_9PEZI|nr:hypothetical protein GcC1_195033 [Golovinomyces cichoracearum]